MKTTFVKSQNKNFNKLLHKIAHYKTNRPCDYTQDVIDNTIRGIKLMHFYGEFMLSDFKFKGSDTIKIDDFREKWTYFGNNTHQINNVSLIVPKSENLYNKSVLDTTIWTEILTRKNGLNGSIFCRNDDEEKFIYKIYKAFALYAFPQDKKYLFTHVSPIKLGINVGFIFATLFLVWTLYIFYLFSLSMSLIGGFAISSMLLWSLYALCSLKKAQRLNNLKNLDDV